MCREGVGGRDSYWIYRNLTNKPDFQDLPFDIQGYGMMEDPIKDCCRDYWIPEYFAPSTIGLVGREDRRGMLIPQ